jgi:hypothetical protein
MMPVVPSQRYRHALIHPSAYKVAAAAASVAAALAAHTMQGKS